MIFIGVVVSLIIMSWVYCVVHFLKWFYCDHDHPDNRHHATTVVVDEEILYDLTPDQRRAVLEAIFSGASTVRTMKFVSF